VSALEAALVRVEALTRQGRTEDALTLLESNAGSATGEGVALQPRINLERARAHSAQGRHDDALAEAAAGMAPVLYPELPTAVGFCMFVRREALRRIGGFDAETFGRGYGEENDFCLRAAAMGWRNVLCETAYVVHLGGASFGPLDMAPGGENLERLLARWPDYNERIARFIMADPLAPLRLRLIDRLQALAASGPQRDLFG